LDSREFDLTVARRWVRRANRILLAYLGAFAAMWFGFAFLFLTDSRWPVAWRVGFGTLAACIGVFFGAVLPWRPLLTPRPLIRPVPDRLVIDSRGLSLRFKGGRETSRAWDHPDFVLQMTEWSAVRPGHTGLTVNFGGVEGIPVDRSTFDALSRAVAPWNYERVEQVRSSPPRAGFRRSVAYLHAGNGASSRQVIS
jgi:hypothetical protein